MGRALLITLLVGCGHTDQPGDPVEITRIEQRGHEAECRYELRCGLTPSYEFCEQAGPMQLYGPHMFASPSLVAAVQAGVIEYDGAQMAKCIEAIAERPCDRYAGSKSYWPAACLTPAYVGTIRAGGACIGMSAIPSDVPYVDVVNECASQVCDTSACKLGADSCCYGTCVGDTPPAGGPIPIGGGPCQASYNECEDGAYCDTTTYPYVCVAQRAAGAACEYDFQCGTDLGCFGTPGTCEPVPVLGQLCPDGKCRDVGTYCNSAGVCARVKLPGDPCVPSDDCLCGTTNHICVPPPVTGEECYLQVIDPCDPGFACYDNSFCESGICTAPKLNGARCNCNYECRSGNCDSTTFSCTPESLCF